jgi:hypothetical protein
MKSKLDKLTRIDKLQRRLHNLSLWRLIALGHARDRLTGAHVEMLDALGTGLFAFGDPAAAATRRIRALEREIAVVQAGYAEQAKLTLEHGVRSKVADVARESASAQYRADAERRNLAELIDWSLRHAHPGSRKP